MYVNILPMDHSTETQKAVATTPPILLVCCLNDFFDKKNEGLPSRFAIKWSLALPRTRSNFTRKLDFFRFFRCLIIFPKFFNRFCSLRLHCDQDIPTNNSFFLKKSQMFWALTILRRKTSKNEKFHTTCKLCLRFSRSRSENVPENPWINSKHAWFCPFLVSPN